jgi:hypothetical protein
MEVKLLRHLPPSWTAKKPIETYETTFLYIGFSRYDTAKQKLSNLVRTKDGIFYTETPASPSCLARCYTTEHVRVTVYSESPRVWIEDVGVSDRHVFVQQQDKQTS